MLSRARRRRRGALALIKENRQRLLALGALLAILAGGLAHLLSAPALGDAIWAVSVAVILVPLVWSVISTLRHGDVGVDAIALIAMAGALALGEYLAGAVIALMLSGGNALEAVASGRARRELTTLIERVPRIAHVRRADEIVEIPVDDVRPGDIVLVRNGEVVPVDGVMLSAEGTLDEATLTGEPLPVGKPSGAEVLSGSSNAGDVFELRCEREAAASAYAALVRLVEQAQSQQAPFVRLADRYAAIFLPITLAFAGTAWVLSGDPVRALAVMVVATPCPLILAAPIALISGVSRAARRGVIVKGGGAIESLGQARSVLLDKTGTLTLGTPEVAEIVTYASFGERELVTLAASLDQLSAHVLAEAIVHYAEHNGLELSVPEHVTESPGQGIEGEVNGHRVVVGSPRWVAGRGYPPPPALRDAAPLEAGSARVVVGIDDRLAGLLVMADRERADAAQLVGDLHHRGIARVAMVTGDHPEIAASVADRLGIDEVHAEQTPDKKLDVVRKLQSTRETSPVVMVGDGVNDAPALALADVGIAMGVAGATVSSEAADAVIMVDRVDRVADAIAIGHRSFVIAKQSVVFGIGLSVIAMVFAAFGYIAPVAGALLQEGIDVAVILNALRALRG